MDCVGKVNFSGALVLGLSFAAGKDCAILPGNEIVVESLDIAVRDVADMACLPPGMVDQIDGLIIARLPERAAIVEVTRRDVSLLVRRRVPGLNGHLKKEDDTPVRIRLGRSPAEDDTSPRDCSELSEPVRSGEIVTEANVQPVPCDETRPQAPTKFDRRGGVVRASAPLASGMYLGRLRPGRDLYAEVGDEIIVSAVVGPVRVERKVKVLQPARNGEAVFVQGEDRRVFSVEIVGSPECGGTGS